MSSGTGLFLSSGNRINANPLIPLEAPADLWAKAVPPFQGTVWGQRKKWGL